MSFQSCGVRFGHQDVGLAGATNPMQICWKSHVSCPLYWGRRPSFKRQNSSRPPPQVIFCGSNHDSLSYSLVPLSLPPLTFRESFFFCEFFFSRHESRYKVHFFPVAKPIFFRLCNGIYNGISEKWLHFLCLRYIFFGCTPCKEYRTSCAS